MYALEQPLVLERILQYAGPDQWLFLGAINKAWAEMHESAMHERPSIIRTSRRAVMRVYQGKTTSFAAASASVGRVLYACACDSTLMKTKLLPLSKAATTSGSIDVLMWVKGTALRKWADWHQQLCLSAVAGCQLATVQWLLAQSEAHVTVDVVKIAAAAAKHADLAMLQWACNVQSDWTEKDVKAVAFGAAAAADAIEKLDWLHNRFPEQQLVTPEMAHQGIVAGSVQSLQWLAARGIDLRDLEFTFLATVCGQFGVLRYLSETVDCPWNAADAREAAAEYGSVNDLQWLREADSDVWTTAVLSQLLVVAGQSDNVTAAVWLRAAGI
jgi:hypothetical protein